MEDVDEEKNVKGGWKDATEIQQDQDNNVNNVNEEPKYVCDFFLLKNCHRISIYNYLII